MTSGPSPPTQLRTGKRTECQPSPAHAPAWGSGHPDPGTRSAAELDLRGHLAQGFRLSLITRHAAAGSCAHSSEGRGDGPRAPLHGWERPF